MIEFIPFPLFIGLGILMILLIIQWHQTQNVSYLFCFSIFWIYLLIVVGLTLFPIPLLENIVATPIDQRMIFTLAHVNLIPFKYFNDIFPSLIFREILTNILLTVPFGFGISFITRGKPGDIFRLAIVPGLAIESAQLAISLRIGGPYRTVDITDVLLNVIGVLLGYGLFRVFAWLYKELTQQFKIKHRGFSAYIYDILSYS